MVQRLDYIENKGNECMYIILHMVDIFMGSM